MAISDYLPCSTVQQIGGNTGWVELADARVLDSAVASCDVSAKNSVANVLVFDKVPVPMRIGHGVTWLQGLEVSVTRSGNGLSDSLIQLYNSSGTAISANKAGAQLQWPSTLSTAVFGGATDMWNLTNSSLQSLPLVSIGNDTYFDAQLRLQPSGSGTAAVDSVRFRWHYTIRALHHWNGTQWVAAEINGASEVRLFVNGTWITVQQL